MLDSQKDASAGHCHHIDLICLVSEQSRILPQSGSQGRVGLDKIDHAILYKKPLGPGSTIARVIAPGNSEAFPAFYPTISYSLHC